MNFSPIHINREGQYKMNFSKSTYSIVEQIQLLERYIMTCSFAYYQLDDSLATDRMYDRNSYQLVKLMKEYPEEAKRSRYHPYFYDYTGETGYHLIGRVRDKDPELYNLIQMQAGHALRLYKACITTGETIICPHCDSHATLRRTGLDSRAYICSDCGRELPYNGGGWAERIDNLLGKLKPWYSIRGIRPWSIHLRAKDYGSEIWIGKYGLTCDHDIPEEAKTYIAEIQEQLVDLSRF